MQAIPRTDTATGATISIAGDGKLQEREKRPRRRLDAGLTREKAERVIPGSRKHSRLHGRVNGLGSLRQRCRNSIIAAEIADE